LPFIVRNGTHCSRDGQKTEGVGETQSLADALICHRNRGASEHLHCAGCTATQPGPYDAIFETKSSKIKKLELELLLLRCLLLSTFRHCCPPSHGTWRMSASVRSRIETHRISFTTAE